MKCQGLSNQEVYRGRLLEEFSIEPPSGELLISTPIFYDHESDRKEFLKQRSVFEGKKWHEVNFDDACAAGVGWGSFPALSNLGEVYYFPSFLSYFYEVKNLKYGLLMDYFDDVFSRRLVGRDVLDEFTLGQAKLVAFYLANMANLASCHDGPLYGGRAQRELTSNWGHFLLF